jgi:uncharacterized membrane protein YphA (DoxX/SURF4 family)
MWAWSGLLARLVVGAVWIWAGVTKLPDPTVTVRAVRAYEILPESVVPLVGHALPVCEVVLGATLVAGVLVRVGGVLSALLLLAFVIGIASVWARGIQIDCGCFGGGGFKQNAFRDYPWEIARDVGLMALSLLLVWRPKTELAVDNWLLPEMQRDV